MHAEVLARAGTPSLKFFIERDGNIEERELPWREGLSIGREPDCDVVLASATVSRKHVSFLVRGDQLLVRDHSSNGTNVDGQRLHLTIKVVGQGCTLTLGPYRVVVKLSLAACAQGKPRAVVPGPRASSGLPSSARDARSSLEAARQVLNSPKEASVPQRKRMRAALLESLDLVGMDRQQMQAGTLRPRVLAALDRIASTMAAELPLGVARAKLIEELCNEVLGLGPLEPLLSDPDVSEVMVVDASTIYAERKGRIELSGLRFTDDTAVRAALERIVTPLGRRIDESNPIVDARLADGSRVNAVIPPLAIKGPCITIRKFPARALSLEDLVSKASLTEQMAQFLARSVRVRCNIVISGGTGSGKTTLLNVLSASILESERVVTIEDAAELQLAQRHVVSLESRPSNMEGAGAITIRDLVKNALRMRPDRIVVGECRGGEALDMLQAMNTGHEGSMTTTHANSPREAVHRLETLCLMSGLDLPAAAIRRQLGASLDLIVQQARFSDGSRRVTHITEVAGLNDDGEVELRDIYRFDRRGVDSDGGVQGQFSATGFVPAFIDRFITHGLVDAGACL